MEKKFYKYDHKTPYLVIDLTEEELKWCRNLTAQDIYEHLKSGIGTMVALGDAQFLPCLGSGRISLSCQISYRLWSLRDDKFRTAIGKNWRFRDYNEDARLKAQENSKPMTAEEFVAICGSNPEETGWIDFMMAIDGRQIGSCGQATLKDIVCFVHLINDTNEIEGSVC